ncbi:MAG: ABC transporter ATP-binding protein [Fuerstiella sp.]
MSDSSHTVFQRVISTRQLFTKLLFPTTLMAFVSSLLVAIIAISIGLLLHVLKLVPFRPAGNWAEQLLQQFSETFSFLQSEETALAVLTGILVVSVFGLFWLRSFVDGSVVRHVSEGVNRLRHRIHRQALRLNPGDLTGSQQTSAAEIFELSATQLERTASRWGFIKLSAVCDLVVVVATLFFIQWVVAIECLIPILVCWYVARAEWKRHASSAALLQEQVERGLSELTSDLQKARIVAGYGMAEVESQQFQNSLDAYQDRSQGLRLEKQKGRTIALISQVAMVAIPGVILIRHLLFGDLIGIPAAGMTVYLLCALVAVLNRVAELPNLQGTALVAAQEINEYLMMVPPVSQVVGAKFLDPMSRVLQFNQVCLHTDGKSDLLNMVDLKVPAGQRLALLALDDLESSALINLIPRFIDPARGQVLIDGQDIRKATLESLRAEVVIVGGVEPVFSGSILSNIVAGRADISRQDAIEASKLAHAENFIRKLPKGYETMSGDLGSALGPGHLFRLGLARAIARKPALLIVKEPDCALDSETKALLDDTYQRICRDRTVIFLPSRLSTVKKCDRLVMLHHGQVALDGKHEDLVKTSELYRHWEYIRFNMFRDETA